MLIAVEPARQDPSVGRLVRRRDFNADAVRRLEENLERGMIAEHCGQPAARRERYPIVEVPA